MIRSARIRELLGLVPVALLVTAGFTAVLLTRTANTNNVTVTYGIVFLGLCVLGHLFVRARLPDADPYMYPLVALLAAFGLVMIYRIDAELAREQAQWFVLGLIFFVATIVFLRDIHALERYRYTIAAAGIALLLAPRIPGLGEQVGGAYLAIKVGPIQFQPAEFGKLAIIIFLASYLRDTRELLVRPPGKMTPRQWLLLAGVPAGLLVLAAGAFRLSGVQTVLIGLFGVSLIAVLRDRPSPKHFGPLLVVWGAAMLMLLFIQDLGSSLMFFGAFLALLYVATSRISLVGVGSGMFLGGAIVFANSIGHIQDRIQVWETPFRKDLVEDQGYQIAQSLFAQADGGLFGRGFGRSLLEVQGGPPLLPEAHTDLIYAVITNELGLFGATAVLLACLLFVARGFKTAMLSPDAFSKLLAAGLSAVFALQVFVIVGGVTKAIPLTGVTLPFVSYGGSSIVANMVLLALLLIISNEARSDRRKRRGGLV